METRAKAKNIRMSPRKVRFVVNIIRGLEVSQALDQLKFINKWAARPVEKIVKSAVANAKHNHEIEKENLYIKEIRVDEGPTLHRWKPRAFGRAAPIRKRTSSISVILAELKEGDERKVKKQKVDAPIKLDSKPKESTTADISTSKENGSLDKARGKKIKDKKGKSEEEKASAEAKEEYSKKIIDPRSEGRGGHTKIEGQGTKGFVSKIFRRKSG